jgi:hypothetical protein
MKMPVFAAAVAALIAVPAAAQPPPKGWVGPLSTPSILCDTRAQVESIVDAFEHGTEAGTARFAELFQTMNNRQEPTCAIAALRTVVAVDSTDLGQLSIAGESFSDGSFTYRTGPAKVSISTSRRPPTL